MPINIISILGVVLRDIVKRNRIRDVELLERITAYVMANAGTVFSASSIAKFLKNERRTVSTDTDMIYLAEKQPASRSCPYA